MTDSSSNPEVQQNKSVDDLSKKIQDATNELNQLKSGLNTLSIQQKDEKLSDLESSILTCTQDLKQLETETLSNSDKEELKKLKSQIDTLKSSKDQLKQQIESETKAAMEALNQEVTQSQESSENPEEKKKETGKKILRVLGGVGIVAGTVALFKRIFGKKGKDNSGDSETKEEKREKRREKSKDFRQRPIGKILKWTGIGTAAYYVAHGLYTKNRSLKDLGDREKGKKLDFDSALEYCKGAIANQNNQEGMSYGMDLDYHEDTGEIEAYGERIKIDKKNRKIVGVGLEKVKFKKYESIINTAILIAYLKKNYSGKCANNNPFYLTSSFTGNVNVNTGNGGEKAVDGTGNGATIVGVSAGGIAGIVAGIYGGLPTGAAVGLTGGILGGAIGYTIDSDNIMHNHMPELDSEFGRKSLGAYLNSMDCWQARNRTADDITESPIKDTVASVQDEIQNENPAGSSVGGLLGLDARQDSEDPEKYYIDAYGRTITARVTGEKGSEKMKILEISGGKPAIRTDMTKGNMSNLELPLKEGIHMSSVLSEFLDKYHHKGTDYPRFYYDRKLAHVATSAWSWIKGRFGYTDNEYYKGIYFNDSGIDTQALSYKSFEERMPTLFKANHGENFLKFLNDGVMDEQNVSIWKQA